MKVNNLTGIELDYWLAKAEGLEIYSDEPISTMFKPSLGLPKIPHNQPTKERRSSGEFFVRGYGEHPFKADGNFIGQIIERDKLSIMPDGRFIDGKQIHGFTAHYDNEPNNYLQCGSFSEDLLEAIKRCIVKRKYGEEINGNKN